MIDPFNSNSTCTDSSSLSFDWSKLPQGFVASNIQISTKINKNPSIVCSTSRCMDFWNRWRVFSSFPKNSPWSRNWIIKNRKENKSLIIFVWSFIGPLQNIYVCDSLFLLSIFLSTVLEPTKRSSALRHLIPSKLIVNIKYIYRFYLTVHAVII